MKSYWYVGGCCVFATILAFVKAEEPGPRRVLILANEDTVVGNVIEDDGRYRVQEGSGETIYPFARVLKVCDTLEEAYAYLRGRANLRDPDEHVRLARWCQRNRLTNHEREEAEAALKLRPNDEDALRILRRLSAEGSPRVTTPPGTQPAKPPAATRQEESYKQETLMEYTRRIQPILMNGCGLGSCHGNNNRNGYELTRPAGGGTLTAMQTRQNMLRALALVDRDEIENSPLLRKALETHGGAAKPPLGARDTAAFRNLEAWVKTLGTAKPAESAATGSTADTAAPVEPLAPGSSGFASERDDEPAKPMPKGTAPSAGSPKTSAKTTAPADEPKGNSASRPAGRNEAANPAGPKVPDKEDPFDPAVFNRQYHSKQS
jgi:hypothetical protein